MTKVRPDAEPWCVHAFIIRANGELHWQSETGWKLGVGKLKPNTALKIPFGKPAGSPYIVGRGARVKFSGHVITTLDIIDAKAHDNKWWWQKGGSGVEPSVPVTNPYDLHALRALSNSARNRIELDPSGDLVWRRGVPGKADIKAGDYVTGTVMTGNARCMVSLGGVGVMKHDLEHFLRSGWWPWQPRPEPYSSAGEASLMADILTDHMASTGIVNMPTYDAARVLADANEFFRERLSEGGQLRPLQKLLEVRLASPVTSNGRTIRVEALMAPGADKSRLYVTYRLSDEFWD